MGRSINQAGRAGLLAVAGALAACTASVPDFTQVKLPTARTLMPQNVDTYVPPVSSRALRAVGPGDVVDAQDRAIDGDALDEIADAFEARRWRGEERLE